MLLSQADARRIPLPDGSAQCVVTSPPYWGLRDYGLDGRGIGLEGTPEEYVAALVAVFREVRRVLRDDGVVFLNLGDAYAGSGAVSQEQTDADIRFATVGNALEKRQRRVSSVGGLKPKDLIGISWRVALALQSDGWWLRSDIIWHKTNPMPESVRDRPTRAHEYVFLLSKKARYFYDAEAVREPHKAESLQRTSKPWNGERARGYPGQLQSLRMGDDQQMCHPGGRNKRTVWTIPTAAYPGAHFATFPPALVEPMVLAGTSERGCCPVCGKGWERVVEKGEFVPMRWAPGDDKTQQAQRLVSGAHEPSQTSAMVRGGMNERVTVGWRPGCDHDAEPIPCTVLDPFSGTATVGQVCAKHGRHFVGLDLKLEYCRMGRERLELSKLSAWNEAPTAGDGESLETLPLFAMQEAACS